MIHLRKVYGIFEFTIVVPLVRIFGSAPWPRLLKFLFSALASPVAHKFL
jgi:hypothetical protein